MKKPRKSRPRPRSDVGRKVAIWLAEQKVNKRKPSTEGALAKLIGVDRKTIVHWETKGGRPTYQILRRLALAMGVDMKDLTDDERPEASEATDAALDAVWRMMPREQKIRLAPLLKDPQRRAAWIAAWEATSVRSE